MCLPASCLIHCATSVVVRGAIVTDVLPFIQAVQKMKTFYKAKKLDLFKDGVSLPGLVLSCHNHDITHLGVLVVLVVL
jgi:hypothetical protein